MEENANWRSAAINQLRVVSVKEVILEMFVKQVRALINWMAQFECVVNK